MRRDTTILHHITICYHATAIFTIWALKIQRTMTIHNAPAPSAGGTSSASFLWPSAGTLGTHKNIGTVTCLNCRLNLVIGIRASLKCSAPQKPTMFSKECMFSCQMPSRDHSFLPLFRAGQNGAICHHDIVVCKNASVREFLWHAMAISCSPMIPMHPDATSSPTLSKDQSVQDTPPNLIGPWIPRRWHLRPVEVSHANRPEIEGDTGRVGFVVSSARSAIPGHPHYPPFFSISNSCIFMYCVQPKHVRSFLQATGEV